MIPYYEELNDEEKDAVTKVIRTLFRQTFILERKYDKKSGRLVYNKDNPFIFLTHTNSSFYN